MEYIYEDLFDSNFIKTPYSAMFVDKELDEKFINYNVLIFTNSIYTLSLCLREDLSFTANKLCVVIINELDIKNDFSDYDTPLLNFFQEKHGYNSLNTEICFYLIPVPKKISYEIIYLSR